MKLHKFKLGAQNINIVNYTFQLDTIDRSLSRQDSKAITLA